MGSTGICVAKEAEAEIGCKQLLAKAQVMEGGVNGYKVRRDPTPKGKGVGGGGDWEVQVLEV